MDSKQHCLGDPACFNRIFLFRTKGDIRVLREIVDVNSKGC